MSSDRDNQSEYSFYELLYSGRIEENIRNAVRNFGTICEGFNKLLQIDWDKIGAALSVLPDTIRNATNVWASFGWVPNLPSYIGKDLIGNLNTPETQDEANTIMLEKIDEDVLSKIIESIANYADKYGQNQVSFSEAVKCFDASLYSASAVLLLSIIDSIFVNSQKKPDDPKRRRELAKHAVEGAINEEKARYSIIAHAAKNVVETLFSDTKDFSIENGLNRNMLCHGMNHYNPDRTDCIKLLVLIYNIYFMFESDYFIWFNDEDHNNERRNSEVTK